MELQGRDLRPGDTGSDVRLLQHELLVLGARLAAEAVVAQEYDKTTRSAVVQLQQRAGVGDATGEVDAATAKAINAIVDAEGKTPSITGRVVAEDGRAVGARSRVEVRRADAGRVHVPDGVVGLAFTNADGAFSTRAHLGDQELEVPLAFAVHPRGGGEALDIADVTVAVDREARRIDVKLVVGSLLYAVRGSVVADGRALPGARVVAFDRDLRTEQPLGEDRTERDGRYSIAYSPERFTRAEKRSADLVVRVLADDGTVLAATPTLMNAAPVEEVDLEVASPDGQEGSEWARLTAAVLPLLDGQVDDPAELTAEDAAFIAVEALVPPADAARFVLAHHLRGELGAGEAPAFYALLRAGLPAEADVLAERHAAELGAALDAGVAAGVVTELEIGSRERLFAALAARRTTTRADRAARLLRDVDQAGRLSLGEDVIGRFAAMAGERRRSDGDLWDAVDADPVLGADDTRERLRIAVQAHALAGGDAVLTGAIAAAMRPSRGAAGPRPASRLADLDAEAWQQLVRQALDAGGKLPSGLPGDDDGARAAAYAEVLHAAADTAFPLRAAARHIEATAPVVDLDAARRLLDDNPELDLADPGAPVVLRGRSRQRAAAERALEALRRDARRFRRESPSAWRTAVTRRRAATSSDEIQLVTPARRHFATLLRAADDEAFDVRTEPVDSFLGREAGARALASVPESSRSSSAAYLADLQRVLQVADRPEHADALLARGLDSAFAVSLVPESMFVRALGPELGSDDLARHVHHVAEGVTASAHVIAEAARSTVDDVTFYAIPSSAPAERANFTTLFGRMDLCDCAHCSSVYSPAAYLVDLLQFLRVRDVAGGSGVTPATDPPIAQFFARRPDIAHLPLTCENTNTALPYVDLVLEVLESFVGNALTGVPDRISGGDTKPGTTARRLAAEREYGQDPAHDFLQEWSDAAYDALRATVHPVTLPFDRDLEAVRVYLGHLGLGRVELLQQWGEAIAAPAGPLTGPAAVEALGLSEVEAAIVAGEDLTPHVGADPSLAELYGFAAGDGSFPAAVTTDPGAVPELLERLRIPFTVLLQLLDARVLRQLDVVLETPEGADPCDLSVKRLVGLGAEPGGGLDVLHRVVRLWRRLGGDDAALHGVDAAMAALGGLDRAAVEGVSEARRLAADAAAVGAEPEDTAVPMLLSLWADLDRHAPLTFPVDEEAPAGVRLPSVYDTLFRNPTVFNEPDPDFDVPDPARTLTEKASQIAAALRLPADDLDLARVDAALADDQLTVANLSALHRRALLARLLGLPVRDLVTLRRLSGIDPFASPGDTRRLWALAAEVRASDVPVPELAFLLLGDDSDPDGSRELDGTTLRALAAALRAGLVRVAADIPVPPAGPDPRAADRTAAREGHVVQTVADAFEVPAALAQRLLAHLGVVGALLSATDLVGDDADPFANPGAPSAAHDAAVTAVSDGLRLAHRAALLLGALGVTPEELAAITSRPADWGGFDLTALPLPGGPPVADATARALFATWRALARLSAARRHARRRANARTLTDVFGTAARPGATLAELRDDLASALGLTAAGRADLDTLVAGGGLLPAGTADAGVLAAFGNADLVPTLVERVRATGRTGVDAATLRSWATSAPDRAQADATKAAAKAQHSPEAWLTVAPPLTDALRARQRDALVAFVLRLPQVRAQGIVDADQLFEWFLIDVEMMPCMRTSRIKQAISSTQLFVQRCLLNLEAVPAERIAADRWRWMKNYRVWEANRKVFLYPENWIRPELRDERSPFFEELESDLLQKAVTAENVEAAFVRYVRKLDAVARLEVVGAFRQPAETSGGITRPEVLHVVARGPVGDHSGPGGDPPTYWYRQRVRDVWKPWEKIELDVVGAHVLPVFHQRRLFLFWPVVEKVTLEADNPQPEISMDNLAPDARPAVSRFSVKLAWSERGEDGWSAKRSSAPGVVNPNYVLAPNVAEDELRASMHCDVWSSSETLMVTLYATGDWYEPLLPGSGNATFLPASPAGADGSRRLLTLATFTFSAVRGQVTGSSPYTISSSRIPPNGTVRHGITYLPAASRGLRLADDWAAGSTPEVVLGWSDGPVRTKTQSDTTDLTLAPMRAFFCADDRRTFFVVPEPFGARVWVPWWPGLVVDGPGLLGIGDVLVAPEKAFPVWPVPIDPEWGGGAIDPVPPMQPVVDGFDPVVALGGVAEVASDGDGRRARLVRLAAAGTAPAAPAVRAGSPVLALDGHASVVGGFRRVASQQPSVRSLALAPTEARLASPTLAVATKGSEPALDVTMRIDQLRLQGLLWQLGHWTTEQRTGLRFHHFFHPYTASFLRTLGRDGVFGLLSLATQRPPTADAPRPAAPSFDGMYQPDGDWVHPTRPRLDVDFDADGAYSSYNWELFFHAPMLIAERLMQEGRYEDALDWFHVVFDPTTDDTSIGAPHRFWRFRPFQENDEPTRIQDLLRTLADPAGDPDVRAEAVRQIQEWRDHPFDPHRIAAFRRVAYMRWVVVRYLDCLIAWGDHLFTQDTIETINQATQLYVLALSLLGPRPERIPEQAAPAPTSYAELSRPGPDGVEPLDAFSNALVEVESRYLFATLGSAATTGGSTVPDAGAAALFGRSLFFCIPKNDRLLAYWDTVEDRLFKVRNCMNIAGEVRSLALFEPPIDPGALVAAAAAGASFDSVLADANLPGPHYRYAHMYPRAVELAREVQQLGAALLSALEKKDVEALAALRARHETGMLALARDVRVQQVREAEAAIVAIQQQRAVAELRRDHYADLLRNGLSAGEIAHLVLFSTGSVLNAVGGSLETAAAAARIVPEVQGGASGVGGSPHVTVRWGGANLGGSLEAFGRAFHTAGNLVLAAGQVASTVAGYARRAEDWQLQRGIASREVAQYDAQEEVANRRLDIARTELRNHDQQVANAREVEEVLRDKYTSERLYVWLSGQLSALYLQSYKLAYECARRAERAYRWELGVDAAEPDWIRFGYWDSTRRGLLAGERLHHDLRRLDAAYYERSRREYELTKHVSLALVDPVALVILKTTGRCAFALPEALFDMDHPGHYRRRIKSATVTIPCVTGPYSGTHGTLRLERSWVRASGAAASAAAYRAARNDATAFVEVTGSTPVDRIALSTGQADAGLFEAPLNDQRYLPFEGAGAVSVWVLEVPATTNGWDLDTISDVVLHLRYTAAEGGAALGAAARAAAVMPALAAAGVDLDLDGAIGVAGAGTTGLPDPVAPLPNQDDLARVFSLRHEFPDAFRAFVRGEPPAGPPAGGSVAHRFEAAFGPERFPVAFRGRRITVVSWELLLQLAPEATADDTADGTEAAPRYPGTGAPLDVSVRRPGGPPVAGTLALLDALGRTPYARFDGLNGTVPNAGTWRIEVTEDEVAQLQGLLRTVEPDAGGADHPRLLAGWLHDVVLVARYRVGNPL